MTKFSGTVIGVQVKNKKVKDDADLKIGRVTIEFDADDVDVAALSDLTDGTFTLVRLGQGE